MAVSCHFFVKLGGKLIYQRTKTLSINHDLLKKLDCWAEHEFSAGHKNLTYSRLEVMGIGGSFLVNKLSESEFGIYIHSPSKFGQKRLVEYLQ